MKVGGAAQRHWEEVSEEHLEAAEAAREQKRWAVVQVQRKAAADAAAAARKVADLEARQARRRHAKEARGQFKALIQQKREVRDLGLISPDPPSPAISPDLGLAPGITALPFHTARL